MALGLVPEMATSAAERSASMNAFLLERAMDGKLSLRCCINHQAKLEGNFDISGIAQNVQSVQSS
jgi:hypothetical protein